MTKFNLKTLAVTAALAATAGQANAAMVNSQGTLGDGNSSVVLYAFSSVRSYSRDLGFNLNDFLYTGASAPMAGSYSFNSTLNTDMPIVTGNVTDPGHTLSFGADPLMMSWLGDGSTLAPYVQWGIAAVDGQGTGSAFRALTTVTIGASSAGTTNSELATFENKFDSFVIAHNNLGTHVSSLNGSTGSDASNSAAANAATVFDINWGGATSFISTGGVGQSLEFFFMAGNGTLLNTNATAVRYGNAGDFATWTLNADGSLLYMTPGAVSAVPVPAAVWLFGSGLVGLIGISHRRKKE
jgi:hypothetical protein